MTWSAVVQDAFYPCTVWSLNDKHKHSGTFARRRRCLSKVSSVNGRGQVGLGPEKIYDAGAHKRRLFPRVIYGSAGAAPCLRERWLGQGARADTSGCANSTTTSISSSLLSSYHHPLQHPDDGQHHVSPFRAFRDVPSCTGRSRRSDRSHVQADPRRRAQIGELLHARCRDRRNSLIGIHTSNWRFLSFAPNATSFARRMPAWSGRSGRDW